MDSPHIEAARDMIASSGPEQHNGSPRGTWSEWANHVLLELSRINNNVTTLSDSLIEIKIEIAMLKVKSGLWGAVGAMIPIAILLAMQFMQGKN